MTEPPSPGRTKRASRRSGILQAAGIGSSNGQTTTEDGVHTPALPTFPVVTPTWGEWDLLQLGHFQTLSQVAASCQALATKCQLLLAGISPSHLPWKLALHLIEMANAEAIHVHTLEPLNPGMTISAWVDITKARCRVRIHLSDTGEGGQASRETEEASWTRKICILSPCLTAWPCKKPTMGENSTMLGSPAA